LPDPPKELNELVSLLEFFYQRLKYIIREFSCEYIYRIHKEIGNIKKELENTRKIHDNLLGEFNNIKNIIGEYDHKASILMKTFITLLSLIVVVSASIIVMISMPGMPLNNLLPYISLIVVSLSLLIVLIIFLFLYRYSNLRRGYNIVEKRKRYLKLVKTLDKYARIIDDKNIRLNELQSRFSLKEYSFCKCYEEFGEVFDLLKSIKYSISKIMSHNDKETLLSSLKILKEYLGRLSNVGSICSSIYTDEYLLEIHVDSEIFHSINTIMEFLVGNSSGEEKIFSPDELRGDLTIVFHGRKYVFEIPKYVANLLTT
jgi:hypothetical protein